MSLKSGTGSEEKDVRYPVINMLKSLIGITLLKESGVSDLEYPYAQVDGFSDSNGYNNTIDTGNTTAVHQSNIEAYICQSSPESTASFSDLSEGSCTSSAEECTIKTVSITESWISKVVFDAKGSETGTNIRVEVYDTMSSQWRSVGTVSIGTGYYTYTKTFTPIKSNSVRFINKGPYSTDKTAYVKNVYIYKAEFSNSVIQTNSKTFAVNIAEAMLVYKGENTSNTSITFDISTDGGTTFEKTGQNAEEVVSCDNDNTDLVIKINLNTTATNETPIVYGYAVQIW